MQRHLEVGRHLRAAERGSIVDLTLATPPTARMIRGWRVLEEESLSDHKYIRNDLTPLRNLSSPRRPREGTLPPRWTLKRADKEAMAEASIVQAWIEPTRPVGADDEAVWFRDAMPGQLVRRVHAPDRTAAPW